MLRFVVASAVVLAVASVACLTSEDDAVRAEDIGKPCSTSAECASGICIPKIGETITPTTKGVCTVACTPASNDCLGGWTCLATGEGRDVCQCQSSAETCDERDNDCNGVIDDDALGVCHCDKARCPDGCFDLASDTGHCGLCTTRCPSNAVCSKGNCQCSDPNETACATACANLQTDVNHCGSCGNACGPGAGCVGGTCRCGTSATGEPCTTSEKYDETGTRRFCDAQHRCRTSEAVTDQVATLLLGAPDGILYVSKYVISMVKHIVGVPRGGQPIACGASGLETPLFALDGTRFLLATPLSYLDLCDPSGVRTIYSGSDLYRGLGVGSTHAFWFASDGALKRCALTGCGSTAENFAPAPAGITSAGAVLRVTASAIYVRYGSMIGWFDATTAAFTEIGTIAGATTFTVGADRIFATTATSIVTCPTNGCPSGPTTFVTPTAPESPVFVDATRAWWKADGKIWSCETAAALCNQPKLELAGLGARAFVADDASLYIGDDYPSEQRLEKIAK